MASNAVLIDSVFYYSDLAVKAYENDPMKRDLDEKQLLRTYNYMAYAYGRKKDNRNAILYFQKALDLSKKHHYKWKSYLISGIARAHTQMGNDSLAMVYYTKASKDTLYMGMDRPAIATFINLGSLHYQFKNIDSAKYYYRKTIDRSLNGNYKGNLAPAYGYMAQVYYYNNELDSSLYYMNKNVKVTEENGIDDFRGALEDYHLNKGILEYYQGDKLKVKGYLVKALDSLLAFNNKTKMDLESFQMAANTLQRSLTEQKDVRGLNDLVDKTNRMYMAYFDDMMTAELTKLEVSYQTKENEAAIAQLEQTKAQNEIIIRQQKQLAFGLGSLIVLLLGFGYLFYRQRQLKVQFEQQSLEQRLLRSQMNPHFIGNAMNTISALVSKGSNDAIPYITKLSNLFRQVLNHSREEFISLGEEIATLKNYLELQSNFSRSFDFKIEVDDDLNSDDVIIPPMLIQPFVENAIHHGFKGDDKDRVEVYFGKGQDGLIRCEVKDNGVGYSRAIKSKKRRPSVSGDILKKRLAILKKKFKVNARFDINDDGKGTQVQLYLPYLIDS